MCCVVVVRVVNNIHYTVSIRCLIYYQLHHCDPFSENLALLRVWFCDVFSLASSLLLLNIINILLHVHSTI